MTHRLVLRCLFAFPHKPEHTANVVIYHPTIWKQIQATADALREHVAGEAGGAVLWTGRVATAAVSAVVVPTALGPVRTGYVEHVMRDFPKGAAVLVVGTLKDYAEFKGMRGVVTLTVQQHHRFICIRFESQAVRDAVQRLNALPRNKSSFEFLQDDQLDLLCCKVGQVKVEDDDKTRRLDKGTASEA